MRKIVWFAFIVGAVAAFEHSNSDHFEDYQIYRVVPKSIDDVMVLKKFENAGYDFWTRIRGLNLPVDIMVGPQQSAHFEEIIKNQNISSHVFIHDLQKRIDDEKLRLRFKSLTSSRFDFQDYHRLDVINQYMADLASKYSQLKVIIGGQSYEGRNITGVHLSYKLGNRAIVIEGGIHAREWITPATVMYILTELLTSKDKNIRHMAENYDWYFFPSFNPDGYEYTHTNNRLWRKTRQPYGNKATCTGADPNRNWDFHFGEIGISHNCLMEDYCGPYPFSEIETKSLSEYLTTLNGTLFGYISFHSYSQLLLIPYGHTSAHMENYDDLFKIGKKAAASLAQRYGTQYTVGNPPEVIYACSGLSMDWAKANLKPPIAYSYEVRDTGKHGFLLPPDQIIPNGEEVMDSLVTIVLEAEKMGYE